MDARRQARFELCGIWLRENEPEEQEASAPQSRITEPPLSFNGKRNIPGAHRIATPSCQAESAIQKHRQN